MPGVTAQGFDRPRLPEIRQEIVLDLSARLRARGYTEPIETRPDSLTGLLIDTFAERETALWEQAEAVYYAMYPSSASGVQLDRAVSFAGVSRLQAEQSKSDLVVYGQAGTVIPVDSQVRNRTTQTLWALTGAATIGLGAVVDVHIRPVTITPGTAYTATVNGLAYTYTSDASPSLSSVLAGIMTALAPAGLVVTSDGATVRLVSGTAGYFALQVTSNLVTEQIGSPAVAESVDAGPIVADAGSITEIITLVPGWDSVQNRFAASVGRHAESDAALRARYSSGVYVLGAATVPSIQANLQDRVPGIGAVRVFENDSDTPDADGRPPHCVHVVAAGGFDQDVADIIFKYKAAGIDTHGAVIAQVRDSEGVTHAIRFDRPQPVYVWINVVITLLPGGEETFPPDGLPHIAANLLAAGSALGIGQDVIWQRLLSAVHKVPGVAEATLKLAAKTTPSPAPSAGAYAEDNITVSPYQIALFDATRIQVT